MNILIKTKFYKAISVFKKGAVLVLYKSNLLVILLIVIVLVGIISNLLLV